MAKPLSPLLELQKIESSIMSGRYGLAFVHLKLFALRRASSLFHDFIEMNRIRMDHIGKERHVRQFAKWQKRTHSILTDLRVG